MQDVFSASRIEGVRVWTAPDNTRVVFDISDTVDYKVFSLQNPNRIVIDFSNTTWKPDELPSLDQTIIKKIRYSTRAKEDYRVVLDLHEKTKYKSFILGPNDAYGYRLVVDLKNGNRKATNISKFDSTSRKFRTRDYIVAIDAGHGGEDPGAIGKRFKTKEKDIVLKVAKLLEKNINQTKGMQAFLVRKGDYYISLRKRINYARRQGADLFVSIHADSFKDPKASGASVYILSEKGASSEAARWLAETENRADLMGGISLDDKGDILAQVLLDLSQSASKMASYELGQSVLQSLGKVTKLHQSEVQQAGFVVLKSPDIPSILVEVGFISNYRGEYNLRKKNHQEKIASAIFKGIKDYFNERGQHQIKQFPTTQIVLQHKVKPGDTLEKIATKHKTTVADIVTLNRLKSDKIIVGQTLEVPSREN